MSRAFSEVSERQGAIRPSHRAPKSERKLRLTWVLPQPSLVGGIRAARELAEALADRGHESVFVHPPLDRSWPPLWKPRSFARRARQAWAHRGGRPLHHLESTTIPVTLSGGPVVTEEDVPRADFVIATWWLTREWIDRFPENRGKKAYFIQHFETHAGPEERVLATYRLPSVKFAVAHWLQKKVAEVAGDSSTQVVPNGFDRSIFHTGTRQPPERPTVGFMYSSRKWKGVAAALDAVDLLREEFPDLRVVSFGDEALSAEAQARGIDYFRAPAQQQLADLYRSAHLWMVPSLVEGFGLPGIEAAGCGTPLVATYSGGPEDYVREGENGYLVPPQDARALARRATEILHASDEEWCRMSEASLAVADEFQWPKSAETLERFLLSQLDEDQPTNQGFTAEAG